MAVSYKKLFKMLIDRDMKKKDFRELTGISGNTVSKLANNENVTMEVIEKICVNMCCTVDDIVEIIVDFPTFKPNRLERVAARNIVHREIRCSDNVFVAIFTSKQIHQRIPSVNIGFRTHNIIRGIDADSIGYSDRTCFQHNLSGYVLKRKGNGIFRFI